MSRLGVSAATAAPRPLSHLIAACLTPTIRTYVFAIGMAGGTLAVANEKTKSEEAFDRLTSLVGEWKGEQDGIEIRLHYTLTADGSALMEEFRLQKGPVMIAMFTVDGDRLIATHYCAPRRISRRCKPRRSRMCRSHWHSRSCA